MEHSRSELLLHPIRWRVIQALMGRELTTSDLKERLADVAVTTLYRQVAILADAGLLRVVAERQVRGAVERTYALDTEQPYVGKAGDLSRDELRSAFAGFSAGLVADSSATWRGTGSIPRPTRSASPRRRSISPMPSWPNSAPRWVTCSDPSWNRIGPAMIKPTPAGAG